MTLVARARTAVLWMLGVGLVASVALLAACAGVAQW